MEYILCAFILFVASAFYKDYYVESKARKLEIIISDAIVERISECSAQKPFSRTDYQLCKIMLDYLSAHSAILNSPDLKLKISPLMEKFSLALSSLSEKKANITSFAAAVAAIEIDFPLKSVVNDAFNVAVNDYFMSVGLGGRGSVMMAADSFFDEIELSSADLLNKGIGSVADSDVFSEKEFVNYLRLHAKKQEVPVSLQAARALRDMAIEINSMSFDEELRVRESNISADKYLTETLFLRCFAIDMALIISISPRSNEACFDIRNSLPAVWADASYKSIAGVALSKQYSFRISQYHQEFTRDQEAPEGALATNFPSAFAHNLAENNKDIPFELMPYANSIFHSTYDFACRVLSNWK